MKNYGIRVSMPAGDVLLADHLLGEDWASTRWFETLSERDKAYTQMEHQPPWYRSGDIPSVVLEKVQRE